MTPEKIAETSEKISKASAVILNKFRNQEDIIKAGVDMTNCKADVQFFLDTPYAEICARAENKDQPTAHINRIYKSETAEAHRLKTIIIGLKNTLRNMEYGGYK